MCQAHCAVNALESVEATKADGLRTLDDSMGITNARDHVVRELIRHKTSSKKKHAKLDLNRLVLKCNASDFVARSSMT